MAEKIRDYVRLASEILDRVGGAGNITSATRCATRLRLVLRETPPDAKDKVSGLAGVISVLERGGQFQVVIGTHVGEVYDALNEKLAGAVQAAAPVRESVINRIIATMSAVFAPVVYIALSYYMSATVKHDAGRGDMGAVTNGGLPNSVDNP